MKEQTLAELNGRKIAIDASMAIYQFLVAVRSAGEGGAPSQQLMNEAGEVTSHLQGMWYRTIKFIEAGIKPVYVFDGKPPTLKSGELAKRTASKEKASKELEAAKEAGSVEDIERFSKRLVRMETSHVDDCKKLLRLMGMPVIEAPCEAEAQCAALAKADKVYAAASEDMDTLTFGAPRLVRKMWASEAAKVPILEFSLPKVLEGLGVTYDQFVDVCILAGCDYAEPIKGIAATTAYKQVKSLGSLAKVVAGLDKTKVPEGVDYDEVRSLFLKADVTDPATIDLKWLDPDEAGIMKFLVEEKGFNAARVESGVAKLKKARSSGSQMRMDAFFAPVASSASSSPGPKKGAAAAAAAGTKRRADGSKDLKGSAAVKKKK